MQETDLLRLAKALAAHRNWSLSTTGLYAAKDGKFFVRIEDGGGCTMRTAQRIVRYFDTVWPADLAWPSDIPRPKQSKKEAA